MFQSDMFPLQQPGPERPREGITVTVMYAFSCSRYSRAGVHTCSFLRDLLHHMLAAGVLHSAPRSMSGISPYSATARRKASSSMQK